MTTYDYFNLAHEHLSGHGVPVIAENVGPYASLEEALDAWPDFHLASDDEYVAYVTYWQDRED